MFYSVSVTDEVNPFLKELLRTNKTFYRRTSKSLGFWFTNQTKEEIAAGRPGGVAFKRRSMWSKVRNPLAQVHNKKAPTKWYGKMRRAFGYEYHDGVVDIGWLSRTAAMYGNWHEEGYRRQVTDKLRLMYHKANVPLRYTKTEIKTPARPIWGPMTVEMFPKVPGYVENKVVEYIDGGVEFSKAKSRRKYKVYK